MTIRDFIREHKEELDECIVRAMNKGRMSQIIRPPLNNTDRQEWILNDESLYRWAKSEGVRI